MNAHTQRTTRIRIALATLLVAAVLCFAPRLAQHVYAQDEPPTCSANCAKGSCSGTGNCTCTCSFWGGTPSCSCSGPPVIE